MCNTVINCLIDHLITGNNVVLWKQGERVISAGPIKVRQDHRFTLVEADSLQIKDVDVNDAGKKQLQLQLMIT